MLIQVKLILHTQFLIFKLNQVFKSMDIGVLQVSPEALGLSSQNPSPSGSDGRDAPASVTETLDANPVGIVPGYGICFSICLLPFTRL